MEPTPLLTPYKMGKFNLAHRVVLPPVTRCRSYENMAQPHNALYYQQRAAPGVLLIAEASAVSETATGYPRVPGLRLTHHCHCWLFNLLVHLVFDGPPPRLETEDIPQMVTDFRVAARNAIRAGFDGVEIHAANGLLVNQFWFWLDIGRVDSSLPLLLDRYNTKDGLSDGSSSLEDRCRRLATDVIAAVVDEVGAHRVGVRLSPFAGGHTDSTDAGEAHSLQLVRSMDKLGVLYCHVVEPRMCADGEGDGKPAIPHRLSPFREAFRGTFIVNGEYDREEGDRAYGRLFLASPDPPERFRNKAELNKYDRSTFYTSDPVVGYTDYPFLGQETQVA
ncbi:hypothetical protein PVAP13_8KG391100 [Panicum virgatum]|uniref:NADH:flavin oxidoreductase/NADH oxidase N-terminal domain-containing protein n=1 Tax=Panicum virgatum TaxID=38727 RepID=A0A8T0PPC4_PANVG|nr:hypothetical protein PVAP13_8KG391100 [Panicum virgatum]